MRSEPLLVGVPERAWILRQFGPAGALARLRVTSDNKLHNDHEIEAEWVRIIGRVVGLIRRL